MSWKSLLFRVGTTVVCVKTAIAYLDPGSGSLLVQLVVAAIVGILATFRFWKSRLLGLFGRRDVDGEDENSVDESNTD